MSFTRKEDRYIETHKTWNNIAQLYEDEFMDFGLYDDTYKKFCDLLSKQDAAVLEIGCGPGNITRHILEINPNLKVLATDVSKKMIDLAKKNNPHIETTVLDCRNLKRIDNKYDGIICGFTIPYLSKPDCMKLIYDCGKLLANDGILYLSFISGNPEKSGFITGNSGYRSYFYYHEINTIRREIELNQMSVVETIEKNYKKSDNTSEIHTIIHVKK